MIFRQRHNTSRRISLITLPLLAVLLPALIFSIVQYRSLSDLENKTKLAVEDGLRQSLQAVSRRTQEGLESLVVDSLNNVYSNNAEQQSLKDIERHLAEVKHAHPEIDLAFVVVHCPCQKRQFAVFVFEGGVNPVSPEQFKSSTEVRTAIDTFNNASLLRDPTDGMNAAVFEQSSCALFPNSGESTQFFVFRPLLATDGKGQIGFVGITLRNTFIRNQLLPQIISEVLNGSRANASGPVIRVLDEKQVEVYASKSGRKFSEMSLPFSPVFRQWKLEIGYADTTVAGLARRQFQQNVLFTLLALALLIVGLAFMLRATGRESKLVEAKATFVSNVSHELKTPLALIRLFGETLEMGRVRNEQEMRDYGRIISRESSRLTQLINNVLDFSRIEAGRREYRFVETDIGEVIEDVLQSCEYQLKNAGFEITTEIQPCLPTVMVDREAIAQALLNLINNAIKYSADVKRIELRAEHRGNHLAVEVSDSGIGIPRAEQSKIFEKFYRVSTGLVHNTRGTGLGLSIVRHIVDAHRGEIVVDSSPGEGSRFTIKLPIANSESAVIKEAVRSDATAQGGYSIAENPHH